jgi:epoxyqueuosine reductase
MSGFHSTVSRREFMKGLGLAGAGIGATSVLAPAFHDLDEMISSSDAQWKRAWWIKNLEFEKPTVELDWSMMTRSDGIWTGQNGPTQTFFAGADEIKRRSDLAAAFTAKGYKENVSGWNLKAQAVSAGLYQQPTFGFIGPNTAKTPEQNGVAKWTGTPEEASQMIRAAMVFYGAATVGMAEITPLIKEKLVRQYDKAASHKKYVFEDVAVGYEGTDKLVYPTNVPLYEFAWTHPLSKEMFRTTPSALMSAGNSLRYSNMSIMQPRIQQFARSLGYTVYGYTQPVCGTIPTEAAATLTGLGEGGRNNGVFISPEYGSTVGLFGVLTDLPLAPTPPVDAGIWRFCHTCMKCANACPYDLISHEKEPTWEIPQIYGKPDNTHIPGKKQFWINGIDCWTLKATMGNCGTCMATCTFNTSGGAIHDVVKATLATTSMFNASLSKADSFFGYGLHDDKEAWWSMSQPTYGFDTAKITQGKNY